MNKPKCLAKVNAKYDVIYNGHTFTSLPAKFVERLATSETNCDSNSGSSDYTIAPGD